MSFYEPYIIYDKRDGREICQAAALEDALLLIAFDPDHRAWKKRKFILDHIVDVQSEALPADRQLSPQSILPDRQQEPLNLV